jgi:hypothetical protein
MKTDQEPVPVILCGGGSILIVINQTFAGVTEVVSYGCFARSIIYAFTDNSTCSLCRVQCYRSCTLCGERNS